MKKNDWKVLGAGVALVGGLMLLFRKGDERQKTLLHPGDVFQGVQGQMVTLRLPKGEYQMMGDDGLIKVVAQNDVGIHSDLVLVLSDSANDYSVKLRFIDQQGESFAVNIAGRKQGKNQ